MYQLEINDGNYSIKYLLENKVNQNINDVEISNCILFDNRLIICSFSAKYIGSFVLEDLLNGIQNQIEIIVEFEKSRQFPQLK